MNIVGACDYTQYNPLSPCSYHCKPDQLQYHNSSYYSQCQLNICVQCAKTAPCIIQAILHTKGLMRTM